jgi:hypothetical protein
MAIRVECINKTHRTDPHERIHSIGGRNADGRSWKLSQPEAINWIETRRGGFEVSVQGRTVPVIVATHLGHKYLKTAADGYHPNNLLALPECP